MIENTRRWLVGCGLLLVLFVCRSANAQSWQAGVARVVITPEQLMWMSGYGSRDHAAEGKLHDLFARASVLRDSTGTTAVFISMDLIGVPPKLVQAVSAAVEKQHGIPRRSLMFACSHTHCGPALDDKLSHMLAMTEADWVQVRQYQEQLNGKIIKLINDAMADLKPARISVGSGTCDFASNRRAPIGTGPFDHQVPVLRIDSADGKQLRGVVFGYACHNTTMGFYQWSGDYAGFAQLDLEERYPGSVAMFFTGCGADQNPLPRRKLELCEKYGRMLSLSVGQVLAMDMTPVAGGLKTAFQEIPLEFDALPSKPTLEQQAEGKDRFLKARAKLLLNEWQTEGALRKSYPYPIQVWQLGGQVTWVALGGEVVIDYQLRLKRELGPTTTWVTGYANDVMAYIPSERILTEGGYEGETSMIYYQFPSKWRAGLEAQIVGTVGELRRSVAP